LFSSFDQYSNIVVSNAVERKVIGSVYYDDPIGLHIIRGENVVLLGDQVSKSTWTAMTAQRSAAQRACTLTTLFSSSPLALLRSAPHASVSSLSAG